MKPPRFIPAIAVILLLGFVLPVLGSMASDWFLGDRRWVNLPLYSVIDVLGAFIALLLAWLLLMMSKYGAATFQRHSHCLAYALLAIGILEGSHAIVAPSNSSVLLHSTAMLTGGLLVALVWLPAGWISSQIVRWAPLTVVAATSAFSLVLIEGPLALPLMLEEGAYSLAARVMNILGGLFFFVAAVRFVFLYRARHGWDELYFALFCILLGSSGVLVRHSVLWGAAWWWWHCVLILGYAVALVYMVKTLQRTQENVLSLSREFAEAYEKLRREVCERKISMRRQAAQYAATRVLADSPSLAEAAPQILEAICRSLDWDMGAIWYVDRRAAVLRCVEIWHASSASLAEFAGCTRGLTFAPGVGLPGRVWADGKSVWISDVTTDANFPRAPVATQEDIHGAFAFPIMIGSELVGVFEFFSHEIQKPDEDLLLMLGTIGIQIGQFMERKQAEEAVRRAKSDLERRVEERTNDLSQANDALQAEIAQRKYAEAEIAVKNRGLETLLYVISHDLREPLRAIENFSRLVFDRYADRLDEKGRDFLRRVVGGAARMFRLLDDILALSRAQRVEAVTDGIDGGACVREALQTLENKITETGAVILVAKDFPLLRANKTWATQAVCNLIANALKFTCKGKRPDVEIGPYDADGEVGIVVRDRGPGVAQEHADRIFLLFQRAVGRDVEGTGAGLAIVREVAGRHGGRAWVQPREGGGSEFAITFGAPVLTEAMKP